MDPAALILASLILPFFFAAFFYLHSALNHRSSASHTPAPNAYPIIGNLVALILNRHRFLDWASDMLAATPSCTLRVRTPFFTTPGVCTALPANVDHLLRSNFPNYIKGPRFHAVFSDLLGSGIFNSDGILWARQRKIASHEFSSRSLRSFVSDVVHSEITTRLLPALRSAARSGSVVDLDDIFCKFAFDNICNVAFGEDPACLGPPGDSPPFFRDFDAATEISFDRFLAPLPWVWKAKRILNVGSERRLRQAIGNINQYAMKIIISREKQDDPKDNEKLDLLSRFRDSYVEEEEEHGGKEVTCDSEEYQQRKRNFLRDIIISFILAGKDSTSTALTWFFWLLSANSRCERRIYEEILETAAAGRTVGGVPGEEGDQVLGYEELKRMDYLQAAITESLRLFPPVPINSRLAVADDELPDGTRVKAGWFADYSAYAMARMEKLWGPDCREFVPERWLDEEGVFVPGDPFRFPVFHAGPRACLGKEMAYLQMKAVAAAVVQGFQVERAGPGRGGRDDSPAYSLSLTLKKKGGFTVRIRRRGNP